MRVRYLIHCFALFAAVFLFSTIPARAQMTAGTGRLKSTRPAKSKGPQKPASVAPTGTTSDLAISTPSPFYASSAGTASPTQTVTVTNNSAEPYTLGNVTSASTAFTIANNNCVRQDLAPGSSCAMDVEYKPSAAGSSDATLSVEVTAPTNTAVTANLTGTTDKCSLVTIKDHLFPLTRGVKGGNSDDATVCWYNASSNLAFVTSVSYLYNPTLGNTLSSDLASLNFYPGIQVALVGNVTSSSCANLSTTTTPTTADTSSATCGTGSTTGAAGSSGTSTSSTSTGPSAQQVAQSLMKGGDFALHLDYPIFQYLGDAATKNGFFKKSQLTAILDPRAGFTINGLSNQGSPSGATNVNYWIAGETYYQYDAVSAQGSNDSPGSLFVDYRGGLLTLPKGYQVSGMPTATPPAGTAAGGLSHHNFGFQQLDIGLVFNGGIKVSAQRYWGSNQIIQSTTTAGAPTKATTNNFNSWQIAVQITPQKATKK